jgi:hypothetical protein
MPRAIRMNAAQYLALSRARDEQRRTTIVMLVTPKNVHVLAVRVH